MPEASESLRESSESPTPDADSPAKKVPAKSLCGENIAKARRDKAMTQERLAELSTLAGWKISRATVAQIETNRHRVNDWQIVILAKVLGVTTRDILPTFSQVAAFVVENVLPD